MCKDPESSARKMRLIAKEDADAYKQWLKNGGRDILADHIFTDDFKAKSPKEESSK